ncbi:unnamed protein product [Protopolystoma xenopodis]|uniref:Uncharacterized protein n=1 Tax=Protopolystoma xenopodis TaxID=117903 RepID=A0A3S4ZSG9_9PLAT|nr:unnamed protein product [Protopolystoma xenopodis]
MAGVHTWSMVKRAIACPFSITATRWMNSGPVEWETCFFCNHQPIVLLKVMKSSKSLGLPSIRRFGPARRCCQKVHWNSCLLSSWSGAGAGEGRRRESRESSCMPVAIRSSRPLLPIRAVGASRWEFHCPRKPLTGQLAVKPTRAPR